MKIESLVWRPVLVAVAAVALGVAICNELGVKLGTFVLAGAVAWLLELPSRPTGQVLRNLANAVVTRRRTWRLLKSLCDAK